MASVIIGARLGENNHIEDHKKISNITLSAEEKNLISKSLNLLTRVPGDCGDEYRKPPFLTASGDLSHHFDSIPNVYEVKNVNHMRKNISSNTSWEKMASYSRAVKFGNRIIVSGTTATHKNRVIGKKDPIAQTDFIIDKIAEILVKRVVIISAKNLNSDLPKKPNIYPRSGKNKIAYSI